MAQVTSLMRHESWTKSGPVVSRLPEDEIEALEGRTVATIADPESASPIRIILRLHRPSRPRTSSFTPARCARCTGIRMRTSGSTP